MLDSNPEGFLHRIRSHTRMFVTWNWAVISINTATKSDRYGNKSPQTRSPASNLERRQQTPRRDPRLKPKNKAIAIKGRNSVEKPVEKQQSR